MKNLTESQLEKTLRSLITEPSPDWLSDTEHTLRVLASQHTDKARSYNFLFSNFMSHTQKTMAAVLLAVVGILALGGGLAWAADGSKPGEALHPVDLTVEQLRRVFITDEVARADFELDVLEERMGELKALEAEGENDGQIKAAFAEVSQQQEQVKERVRTMVEEGNPDEGELNRIANRWEEQADGDLEWMYQYKQEKQSSMDEDVEEELDTTLSAYEDSVEEATQEGWMRQDSGDSGSSNDDAGGDGVQIRPRDQDQTNQPDEAGPGN